MAEVSTSPVAAAVAPGIAPRVAMRNTILVAAGVGALAGFLMLVAGARPDVATLGLLLVAIALVACLRSLHRIVGALVRDDVTVVVDTASEYGGASNRELREERRRLLRAINELRFDHQMGKLSEADYEAVRQGYELRAIEVMRLLDGGATLHPELAARLGVPTATSAVDPVAVTVPDPEPARRESPKPEPKSEPTPESIESATPSAEAAPTDTTATPAADAAVLTDDDATSRSCSACDGINDADARFCKHCGRGFAA